MNQLYKTIILLLLITIISCANNETTQQQSTSEPVSESIPNFVAKPIIGAAKFSDYLGDLEGQKVGLVVNQTSTIGETHLVDSLISLGVDVKKIFAPEHGFRGTADAGEKVKNGKDVKTGLPIVSLYGKYRKPSKAMIADLDILVFDIQDVGARFYTYISTMHYVMEAAAENGKRVLVLDRPNPNGHYVDGPIRTQSLKSFVGMHPIPIVHGLTVAELAKMINGENWLKGGLQADLKVVLCDNYDHNTFYELPIKPSPNLPNIQSIYLYPSLCLFEGTVVSVGRGTPTPFQVYGHPVFQSGTYQFTPESTEGAKNPPYKGEVCHGFNLADKSLEELRQEKQLNLSYLMDYYNEFPMKPAFFNDFFKKLVGNTTLQKQIESGRSEAEIRASWEPALEDYKVMREKYLLY